MHQKQLTRLSEQGQQSARYESKLPVFNVLTNLFQKDKINLFKA